MACPFILDITETADYLEKSLKQAKSGTQKERLLMLWWIKTGQVSQRKELNLRLGRSPATLTRWLAAYRNGGLLALLEEKTAPGATPKIQGETLEKLKQQLASEEGLSSYGAIIDWLKQECGLDLKYDTVNRFVSQKLKAKLKVPRPQSLKQTPGVIKGFKKTFSSC